VANSGIETKQILSNARALTWQKQILLSCPYSKVTTTTDTHQIKSFRKCLGVEK